MPVRALYCRIGLLHDSITGGNDACVKRVLWMSESVMDELSKRQWTVNSPVRMTYCKGVLGKNTLHHHIDVDN
jgi:hypothetical protein